MDATIRQQIISLLQEEELEARDLSGLLSITEKEVYPHLEHIAKSLGRTGDRLLIRPCQCLACGFVFKQRHRFTRPGRCPACHATRIRPPAYRIKARA